jgi:stage V sporulation protein S
MALPDVAGGSVEVLKVSSRSNPNSVAGAVAGVVRTAGTVEMQVVGAGALNQAVKALAIARGFVEPSGIDLVCVPTFAEIEIDGEQRTAIRLCIEDRRAS